MRLAQLVILPFVITLVSCQRFSERPNNFSIEFLYFTQAELEGHVAVSPYGAWNLLSILRILASGDTRAQLEKALSLPLNLVEVMYGMITLNVTFDVLRSNSENVSIRNYMLMHKQVADNLTEFKKEVDIMGVNLMLLDFHESATAVMAANTIIIEDGKKLSLKLPKLFHTADIKLKGMLLANVNSFQKVWRNEFTQVKVENFFNERFQILGKVNMMYQKIVTKFTNMSPLSSQVLELPYENDGKYSMFLILPYRNIKTKYVFEKLLQFKLNQILNILEMLPSTLVDVQLPKFKINTDYVLNKPLNDMGVFDLFDEYAKFSNVSQGLFASVFVQNVNMVVNETGRSRAKLVKSNRNATFIANRPFLYFVIEKTSDVVFISGVYSKPTLY